MPLFMSMSLSLAGGSRCSLRFSRIRSQCRPDNSAPTRALTPAPHLWNFRVGPSPKHFVTFGGGPAGPARPYGPGVVPHEVFAVKIIPGVEEDSPLRVAVNQVVSPAVAGENPTPRQMRSGADGQVELLAQHRGP